MQLDFLCFISLLIILIYLNIGPTFLGNRRCVACIMHPETEKLEIFCKAGFYCPKIPGREINNFFLNCFLLSKKCVNEFCDKFSCFSKVSTKYVLNTTITLSRYHNTYLYSQASLQKILSFSKKLVYRRHAFN